MVMGNCGVGIAPCRPQAREIAMRDLVNVEAIPFEVLRAGITWDWETFPEYLDAARRRRPSLNLAFLAPLTPFRHYVMGEQSMERAATEEETNKIRNLLGEALDAGAFGFSSTLLNLEQEFQRGKGVDAEALQRALGRDLRLPQMKALRKKALSLLKCRHDAISSVMAAPRNCARRCSKKRARRSRVNSSL